MPFCVCSRMNAERRVAPQAVHTRTVNTVRLCVWRLARWPQVWGEVSATERGILQVQCVANDLSCRHPRTRDRYATRRPVIAPASADCPVEGAAGLQVAEAELRKPGKGGAGAGRPPRLGAAAGSSWGGKEPAGTLIVAPTSLLKQWESEIQTKVRMLMSDVGGCCGWWGHAKATHGLTTIGLTTIGVAKRVFFVGEELLQAVLWGTLQDVRP